jgi:hypothetical protein
MMKARAAWGGCGAAWGVGQDLHEFVTEASLLSELHHPNIVQLFGVCR